MFSIALYLVADFNFHYEKNQNNLILFVKDSVQPCNSFLPVFTSVIYKI